MKKTFAFSAIIILSLVAVYVTSCSSSTSETAANTQEDSMKKVIARGEYLAVNVAAWLSLQCQKGFQ